jgi:signal transduction histidine kinase
MADLRTRSGPPPMVDALPAGSHSPRAGLRRRIVTVYAVGVTLFVFLGLLGGYLALTSLLRSADRDDLTTRVNDLSAAVQSNDTMPVRRDPFAQLVTPAGVLVRSPATPPTLVASARELAAAAPDQTTVVVRNVPGLGDDALVAIRPISGTDEYLVVGRGQQVVDAASRSILIAMLLIAPVLILLLTVVVWHLVGMALRPIAALTARAGALSSVSTGERLPEPESRDEVGTLARTLNAMLERIDASALRERAFLDDAAHELRTPVAVLRAELELGLCDSDPAAANRAVTAALAEADRLSNLANDLLVLARSRTDALDVQKIPVDVTSAVRATAQRIARTTRVEVSVTGEELVGDVDPTALDQILSNLMTNAANAGAGRVAVSVDEQAGPTTVALTVDDDGPGFTADLLPVRFDRFNRARARGSGRRGSGLGLAIVAALARAHGGTISADNGSPLGGARVRVTL